MDLLDDPAPGSNTPEFTVSEVAGTVRRLIEGELGWVRVRGEVGRVARPRSGHLYFDLKDDRAVLACMTWKGQVSGLGMVPEEGMEVIAEGKMTASGFQSKFSLNVQRVAVAGEGALMAMLERRRKALAAEGLFDAARKRPLPYLPEVIGVVTSPSGAVIRDILHRLRERFPRKVLIWPVAVQGERCAPEVAAAIEGFNRLTPGGALPRPDLIIVARGGGSVEDLWGFNEEAVVRAAAASAIPLISAVGHETDTTLIDHAADMRAPTPTAAAELSVPVRLDLLAHVEGQGARLLRGLTTGLARRSDRLRDLSRAMPRGAALLDAPRQRLDSAIMRLDAALRARVQARRLALGRAEGALRPSVLSRHLAQEARRLDRIGGGLSQALERNVLRQRERLAGRAERLRPALIGDPAARARQALMVQDKALEQAQARGLGALRDRVSAAGRMLNTLSYRATLARGYAVVRAEGAVITRADAARRAAMLEIEFADGRHSVSAGPPKRKSKGAKPPPEQGTLL